MEKFQSVQSSESTTNLLDYTTRCIQHAGTDAFYLPFFEMIKHYFGADQCSVFFLGERSTIECLLSRDFLDDLLARNLSNAYVEGAYNSDPNYPLLNALPIGETTISHFQDFKIGMVDSYQEHFFKQSDLADKVSILTADKVGKYYINLYRRKGRQSFMEQCLFNDPSEANLLAAIICQHFRLTKQISNDGPLSFLSERERQVCQGILCGKKMEAVGADVGIATSSAITYKKRAFIKLGITSRTSLFNLCHRSMVLES